MRILLVEDEVNAARFLKKGLEEEGNTIEHASNGLAALDLALTEPFDLVLLDIMLPSLDGWTILGELRDAGVSTPVIVLTARSELQNKIKGFALGADDYLTKPFAYSELLARIGAVGRRRGASRNDLLRFEDLSLDPLAGRATRNGEAIDLTAKELQLLELFLRHPDRVLSRAYIAEQVWELSFDYSSNVIDVHIRRLRAKVDDGRERKLIHTVRGRGYVLR